MYQTYRAYLVPPGCPAFIGSGEQHLHPSSCITEALFAAERRVADTTLLSISVFEKLHCGARRARLGRPAMWHWIERGTVWTGTLKWRSKRGTWSPQWESARDL